MSAPADAQARGGGLAVGFFGHDSGESTVIKRATAFTAHGARVTGFMFHRVRRRPPPPATWENFDLGATEDRNYLKRLPRLVLGIFKAVRLHAALRRQQVFYARNIDMLLVAAAAKLLTRSRAIIVYEALDVQPIFVGERPVNRLLRWAERRLMAACELLVVSSADHMSEYFQPLQGYDRRWWLLENKVSAHPALGGRRDTQAGPAPGRPWIIGYFGVLRCRRSLAILRGAAEALPHDVVIHLRGQASETDIPLSALEALAARHPNIKFYGPYANPKDLAQIYGQIHFAWATDYIAAQSNSKWSLVNRFYEGSLFGAVALARSGTATGRMVEKTGLGFTLPEPVETALPEFLRRLAPSDYERMRARLTQAPRSTFVDETDSRDLIGWLEARVRTSERPLSRPDIIVEPQP